MDAEVARILRCVKDCMAGVEGGSMLYVEKGLKEIEKIGKEIQGKESHSKNHTAAWISVNCRFAQ